MSQPSAPADAADREATTGTPTAGLQLGRRAFHALAASALPVTSLFAPRWTVLVLAGVGLGAAVILEVARLGSPAVNRLLLRWFGPLFKQAEHRAVTAATILAFATLLAFLIFPKGVAALSLLLVAVGDPAASLVGRRRGRIRFGAKSVEGTLAFLAAALLVALVLWAAGVYSPLWAGVLAAAVAALVEAVCGGPLPVDDNLAVPLVAGAVLTLAGAG